MSVTSQQVRHIAKLARIGMDDAQIEALVPELNNILGWVEQLGTVDVTGVEPMTAVIPNALRLRDDAVTDGDVRESFRRLQLREGAAHGHSRAFSFMEVEDDAGPDGGLDLAGLSSEPRRP